MLERAIIMETPGGGKGVHDAQQQPRQDCMINSHTPPQSVPFVGVWVIYSNITPISSDRCAHIRFILRLVGLHKDSIFCCAGFDAVWTYRITLH